MTRSLLTARPTSYLVAGWIALPLGADQGGLVVGDAGMETQLIWSHMHGIVSLILTKRIHRSVEHSAMIELALDQIVETRRHSAVKAG